MALLLALVPLPSWLSGNLEDGCLCPNVRPWYLVLDRAEQTLFTNHCTRLFLPVWGYLKDWRKMPVLVLPDFKLAQIRKAVDFAQKYFQTKKICSHIGQKIMVETCESSLKLVKKKLGKAFLWKIRTFKSTHALENLESHKHVQDRVHAQKKFEDSKISLFSVRSAKCNQEVEAKTIINGLANC